MNAQIRVIVSVLFLLIFAPAASAWPVHLAISFQTCPNGTSWNDGCTGAPADGAVYFPNFFTAPATNNTYSTGVARENNQPAYVKTPYYNVAGVNYPVGYSMSQVRATTGTGGFRDPVADPGGLLAAQGCSTQATGGSNGGPRLRCTGGTNLDIEAYDFGLYNCVPVIVQPGNYTGTITFKNNRWINPATGGNCINNAVAATGYAGSAFNGYVLSSTVLCIGTQTQGTGGVIVGNNLDIVGAQNFRLHPGTISAQGGGTCASGFAAYTTSSAMTVDGSSSTSTETIGEESGTAVITTTSGTLVAGMISQSLSGGGNTSASSCVPTCGGPGTYTITLGSTAYSPNEPWVFGYAQNPITFQGTPANSSTTIVQNVSDMGETSPNTLGIGGVLGAGATGSITIQYNAALRCECRPFTMTFVGPGPFVLDFEDNYIEEWGMNWDDGHLEVVYPSFTSTSTISSWKYKNNTILTTPDASSGHGTALLWMDGSGSTTVVTNSEVAYNTTVTNKSNNTVNGSNAVVWGLMERQFLNFTNPTNVHDNFLDGSGTAACIGYDSNDSGSTALTLSNNWNMLTGHIQTNYGTSYQCN